MFHRLMSWGVANTLAPKLKNLNHFKAAWILNCLGVYWKSPWEMQHRCLPALLFPPTWMISGYSAVEQARHPKPSLSFSLHRLAGPGYHLQWMLTICHVFLSTEVQFPPDWFRMFVCLFLFASLRWTFYWANCQTPIAAFVWCTEERFFQLEGYLVLVQYS